MAKRPKYSRWRRLPGLYRTGEQKPADPDQELERLTLYVPWSALDEAERQATRQSYASAQDYCTDLLLQALDNERVRDQVAEIETRHGALDGLQEIAEDPDYLAELSHAITSPRHPARQDRWVIPSDSLTPIEPSEPEPPTPWILSSESTIASSASQPPPALNPATGKVRSEWLSPAAAVILRHAGKSEDPYAFLSCLRRGESVPPSEVAELAQALHQLEVEYRGSRAMDRRLTFALHRLAFESQILHTDAWPGVFDAWTVDMLRAVQEAVERILSGEDIRYGSSPVPPAESDA
ncbi:MAG: hypothetical protein U0794_08525 [Isosphaeraceae bacterium]